MKATTFTDQQIVAILREAETKTETIESLCRKHSIGQATFYRWRAKYGGMDVPQLTRLKELDRENARLKRLLAERDLEIDVLREINAKKWYASLRESRRDALP